MKIANATGRIVNIVRLGEISVKVTGRRRISAVPTTNTGRDSKTYLFETAVVTRVINSPTYVCIWNKMLQADELPSGNVRRTRHGVRDQFPLARTDGRKGNDLAARATGKTADA